MPCAWGGLSQHWTEPWQSPAGESPPSLPEAVAVRELGLRCVCHKPLPGGKPKHQSVVRITPKMQLCFLKLLCRC